MIGGRGGGVEWVWLVERGGDGVYKGGGVYGWMEGRSELAEKKREYSPELNGAE